MFVIAILFLIALSLLLLWCRWRKAAVACLVSSLLLGLLTGIGIIPMLLLHSVDVPAPAPPAWSAHNTIVLLGDGTTEVSDGQAPVVPFFGYSRVAVSAANHRACREHSNDCQIIVSGGDPQHHGRSEAEIYAAELSTLGVPRSDILLEAKSLNTWQNARNSTEMAAKGRTFVIVTSGYQMKRALLYFHHFRPDTLGVASDLLDIKVSLIPSSLNILASEVLLHEQIGIARYYVYNALGLNAPKVSPPSDTPTSKVK
jgi:uncharacterized SAM-binding protein YcdF (DUF218 family)